jgi:hypothetical protein
MAFGGAVLLFFFIGFAASSYESRPSISFSDVLPYLSIGLSGLVGLGFSLALLFDETRHRLWGILMLVPNGVASYFLIQFFLFVIQHAVGPLSVLLYILASAPFLGLAAAVWGIFWKPLAQKRTQLLPA